MNRLALLAILLFLTSGSSPPACSAAATTRAPPPVVVVPTDGMVISTSMTLAPGTYHLPHGISIGSGSSGIAVEMGGVHLVGAGNGSGFGLTLAAQHGVAIHGSGGSVSGYFYGLRVEDSSQCTVRDLDLSHNWYDPKAVSAHAPWLDINVAPDLSDRQNLGGGVFALRCDRLRLEQVTASAQGNGFDVYHSSGVVLEGCEASNCSGWGVHLHNTSNSTVRAGKFNDCIRPGLGDSAGILLVNNSNHNTIDHNQCTGGGDGFFIGNENGSPSNFNLVKENDCSHAAANAFECTFSKGNRFENNRASYSSFGFWLGFSYNSTVVGNTIIGCGGAGVEIDHGQDNVLSRNLITNTNGPGIVLKTDGSSPFASRPWLQLPAEDESTRTTIAGNRFGDNNNHHLVLTNTTWSHVYDNYFPTKKGKVVIAVDALSAATTKFEIAGGVPVATGDNAWNVIGGKYYAGNWWCDDGSHNVNAHNNSNGSVPSFPGVGTDRPYVIDNTAGAVDNLPLFIPNNYEMC